MVGQQLGRPSRILGRNQGHFTQYPQRAQRDVFEIADGRGDDMEDAGHQR